MTATVSRRIFLVGSLAGKTARALEFGKEIHSGEITLMVDRPAGSTADDDLLIAVRTSNEDADYAFVEVFYRAKREINGRPNVLLLHEESIAPLVWPGTFSSTNDGFNIPKRDVQFIRVTLLQMLGKVQEFR